MLSPFRYSDFLLSDIVRFIRKTLQVGCALLIRKLPQEVKHTCSFKRVPSIPRDRYSSLELSVLSQDSLKEEEQENMRSVVKEAEQEVAASRRPWYNLSRIARLLLGVYTLLLLLFGALAWWVHSHSVLPIDVTITREFQENLAPWLQLTMRVISYPGSSLLLPLLVVALFIVLIGPARIYLGDHWAGDVLGSYLIGGVLLGMALWVYLQLKQRGVLETKRARERTEQSRVLRTFPRR